MQRGNLYRRQSEADVTFLQFVELTSIEWPGYSQTAVVIFRSDKKDHICWALGGIPHALEKIKQASNPPSTDDRMWASKVVQASSTSVCTNEQALTILDYALAWKDNALWNQLIKPSCRYTFRKVGEDRLVRAWKVFGFRKVCYR